MPGLSFFPLFASYFSTPPRGFVPVLLRVPFSQPFSLPPFTRNSLSVPVRRRVSSFLSAPRSAPFTNGSVSVRMGATRRRGGARSSSLRLVLVRVLFPFRFSVFPSRSHRSTPRPTFVFSDGRVAVASPRRPLERRSIEADALSSNHAAPSQPNSANFRGSRPSIRWKSYEIEIKGTPRKWKERKSGRRDGWTEERAQPCASAQTHPSFSFSKGCATERLRASRYPESVL